MTKNVTDLGPQPTSTYLTYVVYTAADSLQINGCFFQQNVSHALTVSTCYVDLHFERKSCLSQHQCLLDVTCHSELLLVYLDGSFNLRPLYILSSLCRIIHFHTLSADTNSPADGNKILKIWGKKCAQFLDWLCRIVIYLVWIRNLLKSILIFVFFLLSRFTPQWSHTQAEGEGPRFQTCYAMHHQLT